MAQQQDNPIYWDQAASRFNLTLIFSVIVAVLGIVMQAPLLIILGLGMAGYSWLTTPRQFLLYRDSMVIHYGIPRTRAISFAEISHVELLALPLGERIRIRMVSGSRLMLMMRDPGTFRGHLEDALSQYHGEQTGAAFVDGAILQRGSDTEFGDFDAEPEFGYDSGYDSQDFSDLDSTEAGQPPEAEADFPAVPDPETTATTGGYTERRSGSYTEFDDAPEVAAESSADDTSDLPVTSGSYTETPEPDFSGEGQPSYGAEIEIETSTNESGASEDDQPERPRSPY